MTEAEHVAKAMADVVAMNYDHNAAIFDLYARTAIAALDAFRYAEKRRNCKHINQRGTGMLGSDGSSHYRWHCMECGASGEIETPAGPPKPPSLLFNGAVGASPKP